MFSSHVSYLQRHVTLGSGMFIYPASLPTQVCCAGVWHVNSHCIPTYRRLSRQDLACLVALCPTYRSLSRLGLVYRYHKLRKTFSKFYRRYFYLISKFQVGLKSLLRQGLSEPDFYGDLVYKLKKIVGSNNFSAQFIKIISHYKKIGYNINVLQQTACLVVNPITVGNFAFLFNCTPVGRTSDSMMVPT